MRRWCGYFGVSKCVRIISENVRKAREKWRPTTTTETTTPKQPHPPPAAVSGAVFVGGVCVSCTTYSFRAAIRDRHARPGGNSGDGEKPTGLNANPTLLFRARNVVVSVQRSGGGCQNIRRAWWICSSETETFAALAVLLYYYKTRLRYCQRSSLEGLGLAGNAYRSAIIKRRHHHICTYRICVCVFQLKVCARTNSFAQNVHKLWLPRMIPPTSGNRS